MLKDLFGKKNNNDDYQRTRHDYFSDEMNSYISDRDDDYNYAGYDDSKYNYAGNDDSRYNYAGNDDSKYDYYSDDDFKDEYEKNQEEVRNEEELVYVVPDREKTTGKVVEIDGDKVRISYNVKDKDFVFEYEKGRTELFEVGQTLYIGYITATPEKAYVLPENNIKHINQGTQSFQKTNEKAPYDPGVMLRMYGRKNNSSVKRYDSDDESEDRFAQAVSESYLKDDWCKGYGVISDVNDISMIITYTVNGYVHKIELSKTEKDDYKMGTVVVLQYKRSFPDVYEILEIKDHSKDEQFGNQADYNDLSDNKKTNSKGLFDELFGSSGFGGMQALGGMPSFGGSTLNQSEGYGSNSNGGEVVEWGETFGMIAEDNGEKIKVAYMVDEQKYSIWVTKTKNSWKVGLRMKVKYNLSNPGISSVMDIGNEHLTNRLKEEAQKEEEYKRRLESGRYLDRPEEQLMDLGLDLLGKFLKQ